MRIPKKIPAWMEPMFVYLAKKDGASARAYKPIMGLVETHWAAFVQECSDPPAPRAKKAPPKKEAPPARDDDEDDDREADEANAGSDMENASGLEEPLDDGDADIGIAGGESSIDPEEQARIDEMVREGIKAMPDPLRQSLRKAYGPPRTPTGPRPGQATPASVGPGWRHAEKQADDLYGTFRSEAASVGVPEDHPMALSVSNLYSLAKGAIAARSSVAS
ncbi:hypothetical protein psal_cds_225 [Pandoravirus salinus]|uniref:Uncharacterized protein n=1 Tax=Pandoravirus salinus TaxID=1349410 RepID=A0A291ATN1_9VIRU|nr:hypothetical protein psal_cds_225 [Pandoravirus salinus]ATE82138.1 hypothetical protein psal_cds_225 [Pandoravirus salinus]